VTRAPAPDQFETVAYVYSPSDLAILLSRLGYEGIYTYCAGRCHAYVDLGLTTALGGVRVRVHEEDLADARTILATLDPVPYRAPLPFGFWPLDLLFFLVIAFFGAGPPPRQLPAYVLNGATAPRQPALED
jgi:hypothetical protein